MMANFNFALDGKVDLFSLNPLEMTNFEMAGTIIGIAGVLLSMALRRSARPRQRLHLFTAELADETPDTRNSAARAWIGVWAVEAVAGTEEPQRRAGRRLRDVHGAAGWRGAGDRLAPIARDFHVPVISLSLSITIYLTMLVAMLPISGWCADRFGAKRVFMAATLGFAFFSLCCALSTGLYSFVLARALQGAAAALFAPVGRLILLRQTPKHELVDALAITAMPMLIAPTLGPSLGGFIVQYARWEYIFLLNLPISVLLFLATRATIPRMEPEAPRKLDIVGAILVSGALTAVLTGSTGWSSASTPCCHGG
jgi:hypothetical protein